MPKITKGRTRLHPKPVRVEDAMDVDTQPLVPAFEKPAVREETFIVERVVKAAPSLSETLNLRDENQPTADNSGTGGLKKRTKRQRRHDNWLQKLGTVYPKPNEQAAKKKKKKKNVGALAMDTIADVLPSVFEEEIEEQQQKMAPPVEPKKAKAVSQKARRKVAVNEIVRLQKVLQHPTFQNNPLATIRQHLQNNMSPNTSAT